MLIFNKLIKICLAKETNKVIRDRVINIMIAVKENVIINMRCMDRVISNMIAVKENVIINMRCMDRINLQMRIRIRRILKVIKMFNTQEIIRVILVLIKISQKKVRI
jgi:hypothetical protein